MEAAGSKATTLYPPLVSAIIQYEELESVERTQDCINVKANVFSYIFFILRTCLRPTC